MKRIIFIIMIFVQTMLICSQETYFKNSVEITITDIDFGYSQFYPPGFEIHYDIDFFTDYFENYAIEGNYSDIHYNYDTYPILISGTLVSDNETYKWTYNEGGWGTVTIQNGTDIILVDTRLKQSMTDPSFNYYGSIRRNTLRADITKTKTYKFIQNARDNFLKKYNINEDLPVNFKELDFENFELVYYVTSEGDLIANREISLPESYDPTAGLFYMKASQDGFISEPYSIIDEKGEEILVITISYRLVTPLGIIVLAFDIRLDHFQN